MRIPAFLLACLLSFAGARAQSTDYPYPVRYYNVSGGERPVRMAYMDVKPQVWNGRSVLLLHGKNFNGLYWQGPMGFLLERGFRVLVPDQVGWGLSDKHEDHYSFHGLAENTRRLLDTLGIGKVVVIGHSMGGMLATRFSLLYPDRVEQLIYENPIGLEDYRTFVPFVPLRQQLAQELKADYASLKKYQESYYPQWKPEYELYVAAQWQGLQVPDFRTASRASALASAMIYEQPVYYELHLVKAPTLIIIGQEDRTIVGKGGLDTATAARHGQYPQLGRWLQGQIKGSRLVELKGVGHIPHVQAPEAFRDAVLDFLKR
ncbi:MAG: alpha/beta hydrolase [Chitinophagaceae bacterium]|nr:MAG: alpha/beta hydrolase [Chitinophagaceae bacterium]